MDENLLGAVALLVPNEVTASVSSSTLRRPPAALLDSTSGEAMRVEGQTSSGATRRRRRHHHPAAHRVVSAPYGFAFEWLGSSQQPLRSIDVQFNTEPIWALDFSPDGSFFVSGGDKCVRLWITREILGCGNATPNPIQMESEHGYGGVSCVAVSPNNRRIFRSGARDLKILIHDSET